MSINQLFELSRRSFRVFQAGINTAGQNIANANTEGYHRRRTTLAPSDRATPSTVAMPGLLDQATGTGVTIENFSRARDRLIEQAGREARAGYSAAGESERLIGAMEGVFAPGSDNTLPDVLDRFWNSWSEVGNRPTDEGARSALLSRAGALADSLNVHARGLQRLEGQAASALQRSTDQVNSLAGKIADLNVQIQSARSSGSPDLNAEDQRDRLVGQLSEMLPARVQETDTGMYNVTVDGMALVQEDKAQRLVYDDSGGAPKLHFEGTDVEVKASREGGTVGAQLNFLQKALPETQNQLNSLAQGLASGINGAHQSGFDLDGNAGTEFFSVTAGQEAASIEVAVTDPRKVAASGDPDAPGDNATALAITDMREGYDREAIGIMGDVGEKVSRARQQRSAKSAVIDHMKSLEQGVTGVSIDEEMTNLIENQQAFAASARVLSTAQQMMDTLLQL